MLPKVRGGDPSSVWRTRNVWTFSLASLFSDWGHELVTALLPGFFTLLGAPVIALGLTEGISNLAQAWAGLWGGQENDRQVRRHAIIIAGYILTGVKALIAVVTWWPWVVLLRTVGWLGRGARGPIRDAYIADEVSPEHVGKAYGLREAFDTAGAVLGPLTAAFLITFWTPRTLIAFSAIPAVLTVVVILKLQKMPGLAMAATRPESSRVPIPWSLSFKKYRIATAVFTAGYLAPTFFILRVWNSGVILGSLSAHMIALFLYTLHNIAYAASAYPVGRLADRTASHALLVTGYSLWAAAVIGFVFDQSSIVGWVVLFVATGLATGIIEVGQKMVTVRLVETSVRGRGLGQIAAVRGMGQLAAGVIMGILWTLVNPESGFSVEAGLACLGLILVFRVGQTDT